MRLMTGLDETRGGVRTALNAELRLDPATTVNYRLVMATLVSAWEVCTEQLHREVQLRAEAKALNIQRPLGKTERIQMKRLVEVVSGKMPESSTPSGEYLAAKVEGVEADEPLASPLDEVVSMEDLATASVTQANTRPDLLHLAEVHLIKKKLRTQPPQNPEAFRMRLRTEANTWLMLAARFSNRTWLVGLTQGDFATYVDYFLGAKVNEIRVCKADGTTVALGPSWQIVLAYEFACRRKAFYLVREEGNSLKEALILVVKDAELKEISFTSPLALGNRLGGASTQVGDKWGGAPVKDKWSKSSKGQGKKGEGKGKRGKGKPGKPGPERKSGKGKKFWKTMTPDGRQICFGYTKGTCSDETGCGRVHVCRICFGAHPTGSCDSE